MRQKEREARKQAALDVLYDKHDKKSQGFTDLTMVDTSEMDQAQLDAFNEKKAQQAELMAKMK